MINIIHLTHTDINGDNRIFKQLQVLSEIPNFQVVGIGIYDPDSPTLIENKDLSFKIMTFSLFAKKFNFFGRIIKHCCVFIEFLIKISLHIAKLKPNAIHCHDAPVLLIGLFCKFIFGSKLIYDAHELESNRNSLSPRLQKLIFLIEKISWKHVDLFITVSPAILNWYEDTFSPPSQSCIILNSPELNYSISEINNDSKYFHSKFSIPFTEKVFISIGVLGPGRGIPLLLSAFESALVSSHLVFIGWGELEDEIKTASKKCSKIHYHAPFRHDELVEYILQADYGICLVENVSLSDYLCLPNKLFEYLFAGLPVLGSNFPEISRILNHLDAGLTVNQSSEDAIAAINLIAEKKIEINKDLLIPFSWVYQAKLLSSSYSKLLKL